MKISILLLMIFPISRSLECYSDTQADGQGHTNSMYQKVVSCVFGCDYCGKLRMKVQYSTRYQSVWGCGCGSYYPTASQICYKNGRMSVAQGDLFCCSGELCNSTHSINYLIPSTIILLFSYYWINK